MHGKGTSKYEIDNIGLNSRLDTIQAAIILAKLEGFDWEFKKRNSLAKKYTEEFTAYIKTPFIPKGSESIWAQYTLQHRDREVIQNNLKGKGIPTMIYYPVPMHMQKAYKKFYRGKLVNSEKLAQEVFSLPMYPDMSIEDQEYIIENTINIIK